MPVALLKERYGGGGYRRGMGVEKLQEGGEREEQLYRKGTALGNQRDFQE